MPGQGPGDSPRLIAFYLPQYHPTDVNDRFHGPGYTEWTAVARARPLYRGHRQPKLPGELGFYDLRLPEVRERQATLAEHHGVEGFCYWHYWSMGRRLLELPFSQVLESGRPSLPFCLGWANHDWRATSGDQRLLLRQEYGGQHDDDAHFRCLETAFHDPRYLRVGGKPVFLIFRPREVPHLADFADRWRHLAERSGLGGMHLIGQTRSNDDDVTLESWATALDALVYVPVGPPPSSRSVWRRVADRRRGGPVRLDYRRMLVRNADDRVARWPHYPCVLTNWDNTPRWGRDGFVLEHDAPEHLEDLVLQALDRVAKRPAGHQLVFLKSWNEWAEGNYLEPDEEYGRARLEAVAAALAAFGQRAGELDVPSGASAKHRDSR